jgi:hypothetical protein
MIHIMNFSCQVSESGFDSEDTLRIMAIFFAGADIIFVSADIRGEKKHI